MSPKPPRPVRTTGTARAAYPHRWACAARASLGYSCLGRAEVRVAVMATAARQTASGALERRPTATGHGPISSAALAWLWVHGARREREGAEQQHLQHVQPRERISCVHARALRRVLAAGGLHGAMHIAPMPCGLPVRGRLPPTLPCSYARVHDHQRPAPLLHIAPAYQLSGSASPMHGTRQAAPSHFAPQPPTPDVPSRQTSSSS